MAALWTPLHGGSAEHILSRFITYIVQLEVEAAGVAHRVPVGVSPPQRCSCRLAVCTGRPCPPGCRLHTRHGSQVTSGINQSAAKVILKRRLWFGIFFLLLLLSHRPDWVRLLSCEIKTVREEIKS